MCWTTWNGSAFPMATTRRQAALVSVLSRYRVNLLVDNGAMQGAPVIVENNPSFRTLFGSIEYQPEEDALVTDFSRIRAGSLINAHGGFLMLHLRDLLTDEVVWEKLRRFLRNGRLQIEEPGPVIAPIATVTLEPEAVDLEVKIVLVGSTEQYYELQEADRRKDEFLAMLAHELRNPLSPIRSSLEIMRDVRRRREQARAAAHRTMIERAIATLEAELASLT